MIISLAYVVHVTTISVVITSISLTYKTHITTVTVVITSLMSSYSHIQVTVMVISLIHTFNVFIEQYCSPLLLQKMAYFIIILNIYRDRFLFYEKADFIQTRFSGNLNTSGNTYKGNIYFWNTYKANIDFRNTYETEIDFLNIYKAQMGCSEHPLQANQSQSVNTHYMNSSLGTRTGFTRIYNADYTLPPFLTSIIISPMVSCIITSF